MAEASGQADGTSPASDGRTTQAMVVLAVVALPVLAGIVVIVLFIVGAVFAMKAQQSACGAGLYGDASVPLPAEDPVAPLTVKVASWNTLHKNSTARIIAGVAGIGGAGADVIGFQELDPTARRQAVERALSNTWAFSGGNNTVKIAWRKAKYDLLAQGNVLEFGVERIENGAAGTSIGPKHLQWVELRDRRTRAVFFEVNHHIVPSIESHGYPNKKPRAQSLYRRQMQVMLATVDKLAKTAPVFATGDFNVAAQADARLKSPSFPYVQAGQHGLYSNWRTLGYPKNGTHGSRHIDYVWATTAQAAPVAQQILDRYGSDHHAVLVTISNARAVSRLHQDQKANLTLRQPTTVTQPVSIAQPATGSYDAMRRQQVANARLVEQGVRAAGGSGQAVYVALVAAIGESDLVNLNYGDKAGPDSRGLFQQRASWGTLAQRMNPAWAAGAFMLGPHQSRSGGLLQLPGWEQMPVTQAIHRVQINADPNHYTKFEARAHEIGQQAGINFDAPAGAASTDADPAGCTETGAAADTILTGVGTGPCPLDQLHAPGRTNPRDCNAALTFLTKQMTSGSRAWKRQCMKLVAVAYGWHYSGNDTAYIGAQRVIAAGKMSTDQTNIPKGAVMWWDGRATGNDAGHVAVYDGNGYILTNDAPVNDGRVGRVPWTYPETNWSQKWLGWSPPYLPNAG